MVNARLSNIFLLEVSYPSTHSLSTGFTQGNKFTFYLSGLMVYFAC
jgi:hypothetical protein